MSNTTFETISNDGTLCVNGELNEHASVGAFRTSNTERSSTCDSRVLTGRERC